MIGEKIKRIREIRGFTQEVMANKLNMSLSAYGKIERGESGLSFDKAKEIAKILGVTLDNMNDFNEKDSVHINKNEKNSQSLTKENKEL